MEESVLKKILSWINGKISTSKWTDWLFATLILFLLITRLPSFIENFNSEGTLLKPVILEGKLFPPPKQKSILIFWASWCGPCTIEINRINSAILKNEVTPSNIYAVNLGEPIELVNKVTKEREFKMQTVFDHNSELACQLNVKATPTIVFVDEKGKIDWIGLGFSPSLIYRIKKFQEN